MEISIEFFPPKTTDGLDRLEKTRQQYNQLLNPAFYSVTYGAGGSTQAGTLQTVRMIHGAVMWLPRIYLALEIPVLW